MGKRRQGRVLALQIMYQRDAGQAPLEEVLSVFWAENRTVDDMVRHFAEELVRGAAERQEALDGMIEGYAAHWSTGRLAMVDRNILRLAVFELLHRDDIPPKVTINEAVELAKKYGDLDSSKFVNGILDKIHKLDVDPKDKAE